MSKKGLSMMSMVIYVVLFFVFSSFAVTVGINLNYKALYEKGNVWMNEQYQKLQFNIISSAKESVSIDKIQGKIIFSNGDEYMWDETTHKLLKNGGVVASDIKSFDVISNNELNNMPTGFTANLDPNLDNLALEVSLEKYTREVTYQLFTVVGDGNNE